ncbi:hypothetical protein GCM10029964_031410 [Kibdelosporangium lantanae]
MVSADGRRVSTLDLVGHGRFTLLTGLAGTAWPTAATEVSALLGMDVAVARIGSHGARDAYGDWSRVARLPEEACLLVRPDGYIAWRAETQDNATAALTEALRTVLSLVPALTH